MNDLCNSMGYFIVKASQNFVNLEISSTMKIYIFAGFHIGFPLTNLGNFKNSKMSAMQMDCN